jgi:solute:Na+ symporter, SSS family
MSVWDWLVLILTLVTIVFYGIWKTRGKKNLENYLKGNNENKWWAIGISVMATQASAITFLSTPGQAYTDGLRFIQFYMGLPLAMIVLSITFIPMYYKLKVYTAYEFLETRFDIKTRLLTAFLFLIQRGLAAGITIYAPAIILSTLLNIDLTFTVIIIGVLVTLYTLSGGTQAVTQTQKQQMAVMMGGMVMAGIVVWKYLSKDFSMSDTLTVAGKMNKLNALVFDFDLNDRYNVWTGFIAAFFLFLSYFGTDQSQVQRYLGGKSIKDSRMGLVMNGLLKIPMQFIILFIGVMVFVFYQFNKPPIFFNQVEENKIVQSEYQKDWESLNQQFEINFHQKKAVLQDIVSKDQSNEPSEELQIQLAKLQTNDSNYRIAAKSLIKQNNPKAEENDKDYIFMRFVMDHLPVGLIGLLFAVMFSAAMSSTASELNALASTSVIDIYKRVWNKSGTDQHYVLSGKMFTALWGLIAIIFAATASLFENLIQAVNLLGSLFYGTILGVFIVAFYLKKIHSNAVFLAMIFAEAAVLFIHYLNANEMGPSWLMMGYLWYNLIGCGLVVLFGIIWQTILPFSKNGIVSK